MGEGKSSCVRAREKKGRTAEILCGMGCSAGSRNLCRSVVSGLID